MAAGNYERATALRMQLGYAARAGTDREAAQLTLDGKQYTDALHRVMHDPAAPGVNYAKITGWMKDAARAVDARGVDADAAFRWVEQRSNDGQAAAAVRSAPRAAEPPPPPVSPAQVQQKPRVEPTPAAAAPGWYVFEGQPGQVRWWDGVRWTDATRPRPSPSPPPPPAGTGAGVLRPAAAATHDLPSRGQRFGALLIDWALICAVPVPLIAIADAILAENPFSELAVQLETWAVLFLVAGWSLFWVFCATRSGRTWGKAVVGAKTVRVSDGEPLSGSWMFWRQLLRFFGSLSLLDAVFILQKDRRTLHDMLSDSIVVTASKTPNPIEFFGDEVFGVNAEAR